MGRLEVAGHRFTSLPYHCHHSFAIDRLLTHVQVPSGDTVRDSQLGECHGVTLAACFTFSVGYVYKFS